MQNKQRQDVLPDPTTNAHLHLQPKHRLLGWSVIKIKHLEKSHCVSGTVLLVKHVYVTHKLFVFI